jgi:sulfhydrogenase subunit beta (sulfur reductase)
VTDAWTLDDEQWRAWVAGLAGRGLQLVAPVEADGLLLFGEIASADDVALGAYGNTRWSPKEFLFPSEETLFSYRLAGDEVTLETPEPDARGRVLLALRPCDASGLARLDEMLLDQGDPTYAERRAATAVVSLACDAARPSCFCTAVGGSPAATDGSDIQLVRLGERWLLRAVTDRGRSLVEDASSDWQAAGDEELEAAEAQRAAVEATIARSPVADAWAGVLEGAFDHPLWESVGERCLNCGICAYVCPSCSCFDVADDGGAYCGDRCRLWDSCTFAQFTKHASGHNPRPTRQSRYRQRVLHKFAYFPLEHAQRSMCVGCGRCTTLCPVGLDIHEAVRLVASAATAEEVPA